LDQKFGRYKIIGEIGRGGMSIVYHAHDPRTDRDVAIKVLPREFLHDPNFRERFEREARTIAALEHPAIVPVYDFGQEGGQPYLVMRHMVGGSLTDRLREGPLPLGTAATILGRIAGALDYAHKQGIIHRDLKPGNILFDRFGEAYLADFGIVQLAEASSKLTGESSFVGTPAYMSPEQVHGDVKLEGRSDIYAMGILLFEMLTGQLPYHADTPVRLMMKHVLDPVPSVRETSPFVPKRADALLHKALAKDPEARYADCASLALAVAELAVERPRFYQRFRRRHVLLGAAAAMLSVACLLGWFFFLRLVFFTADWPPAGLPSLEDILATLRSGPGRGLLWGIGGILLALAAFTFALRRGRRPLQMPQWAAPPLLTNLRSQLQTYNPRLARVFLIAGVAISLLFFGLALNSCVPEIVENCSNLSPGERAPLICNLIP
jgi:serine/threonine-protein kinase